MADPELSTAQALAQIVQTIGVAAVALFWILFRTDKRIDRLTQRIDDLVSYILDSKRHR